MTVTGINTTRCASFSSVQLLSRVWLFATLWITACQASLSITNSWASLGAAIINPHKWLRVWDLPRVNWNKNYMNRKCSFVCSLDWCVKTFNISWLSFSLPWQKTLFIFKHGWQGYGLYNYIIYKWLCFFLGAAKMKSLKAHVVTLPYNMLLQESKDLDLNFCLIYATSRVCFSYPLSLFSLKMKLQW